MSESNSGQRSDDTISLVDLVKSADAPAPSAGPSSGAAPSGPGAESRDEISSEAISELDALLEKEDPEFAASLKTIDKAEFAGADIEAFDIDNFLEGPGTAVVAAAARGKRPSMGERLRFVRNAVRLALLRAGASVTEGIVKAKSVVLYLGKEGAKKAVLSALAHLKSFAVKGKDAALRLWRLPAKAKATLAVAALLSVVLVIAVRWMLAGSALPSFEAPFLASFADVADYSFPIAENEEMEEFSSPLRHPEAVVLLDKIVVNLRPSETSSSNPMGMFEFYLEAVSRETAVEIGDRQAEVLDAVQRTVEVMPYDELVTPAGKNKLKLVLRKNINRLLTSGRVRKVFFKSIVLKP